MSVYNGHQGDTGPQWVYIRLQNVFRVEAHVSATSSYFAAHHSHFDPIVYFFGHPHRHGEKRFANDLHTVEIGDYCLSHVHWSNFFAFVWFFFSHRQSFCKVHSNASSSHDQSFEHPHCVFDCSADIPLHVL